jgi:uncharacterized protein (TIGR03086 family)
VITAKEEDMLDISPATRRMAALVRGVRDEQLTHPTPCAGYAVGELVEHIGGLAIAFTAAATKTGLDNPELQAPSWDASRLPRDWRNRIPANLERLAQAWSNPLAWTGTTRAGGIDMPGEESGLVALDELVLHGWDLARATGQGYEVDGAVLRAVHVFVSQFSGPGHEEERAGLFGTEVPVPAEAPLLDRVLGMAGRQPGWSPG